MGLDNKIEHLSKGIITKSTGSWYLVKLENGDLVECRIIGRFRLHGLKLTNPVAVGDEVMVEPDIDNKGIIKQILPRRNYVARQSPRKKRDLHLIASNIDQALVVATIVQPKIKIGFIDRFLLMTEPYEIPTHIIFNKADIYTEDDLLMFELMQHTYEPLGYQLHLVSAVTGEGIQALGTVLKGKISLIGGQSGVGKSTLISAIHPEIELKTQEISDYTGKGQHTTTFAEMFFMDKNTGIIDTPGIKTLSFNHLEPMDVAHNFREFFQLSENCRFGANCLHRDEPGCAVKEALADDEVMPMRYDNYMAILDEVESINYWERIKKY